MSRIQKIILPVCLFVFIQTGYTQTYITKIGVTFNVQVRVVDKETNKAVKNAEVLVNGQKFQFDQIRNYYLVKAKVGDGLVVSHPGFETVYYTIRSNEEIKIEIEGFVARKNESQLPPTYKRKKLEADTYKANIDSALYYKKKSFDKSVSFIENILKENYSNKRNAATYKLLGDIYFQWKQYDLAASNYKTSLQLNNNQLTKLSLGKAHLLLNQYDSAEKILKNIKTKELGVYYTILVFETLGDVSLKKKDFKNADKNYKKALKIAEDKKVTPKITDLNSKLGEVLAGEGKISQANQRFKNSLNLAAKENPQRSIKEGEKVANYFNATQQFDKEINLRKQTLSINDSLLNTLKTENKGLEKDKKDSITISNDINPQSINYKIGRALAEKEDYKEAIPFLENSIKDANGANDLDVKRDATRKLSEVHDNLGNFNKALKTYKDYVALVDSVYDKKLQEIEQSKRFAKKISDNLNRIASLEKDKELNESRVDLAIKDQELIKERNRNQEIIIYSLIIGIIAMIVFAFLLFRSNKQQRLANNLLALKSMRSQMNPHFIFNALNSVNSFIAVNDERNANRYLSEFSVLMRSVLENSEEDFIPFAKEIELLELYVKLEHNRFKEKFDYTVSIDESIDLDAFSIPPMLLQPYIENAIWHGLRYKEQKGKLKIDIQKIDEDSISVVIQDDGVGRKRSKELKTKNQLKQQSKGMSTIQKRVAILNNMYQNRIDVQVSDVFEDGSGTKVKLILKRN